MAFKIIASATYLPKTIITSSELDQRLNLKPGTCSKRYGVQHRHFANFEETAVFMGCEAIKQALIDANLALMDIDLLISASGTSHQVLPYNGASILAELKDSHPIASMDINSSCLSFLSALDMAHCAIDSGRYKRILIVTSEVARVGITYDNPEISSLFADGAAAFILEADSESQGLVSSLFKTYPQGYEHCQIRSGGSFLHPSKTDLQTMVEGSYFYMDGKKVFKQVATLIKGFLDEGLQKAKLNKQDIQYIVPHQASHLGLKHIESRLGFKTQPMINIISTMGNQIAASIPIALDHLIKNHKPEKGSKILIIGSGAGLSLGMGVLSL
ncbi:3-oxoacyl-[acyl-carrier-protein] synthase III C-terminal domain-containing protein [Marinicellulosiphila megalodicopiae]|uniref:3-oxoacyl-[acyl-carrier-protein] synthase III C-terminal domain-containing protein n=1 Tax=Marinicellulosiphila megalodicopiae TaxID=2724896 RepID=UPI003BAF427C